MDMDVKDKKLLYELDKNARQNYSVLAKKLGLSQELVRYRIKRLEKEGIINKYFTIINSAALGISFTKVLLRLHNVNSKKEEEIMLYLREQPQVVWQVELNGSFDIGFVLKIKNMYELNTFLDLFYQKYSNNISNHKISTNIFGEYLDRTYLIDTQRDIQNDKAYSAQPITKEIDEKNSQILKLLGINAREQIISIAQKIHLSADATLKRIKRLQEENVITGYTLVLNHKRMQQIHYKVLIYLNDFNPQKINHFLASCKQIKNIVYIIKALGDWNYELDIECKNINKYRDIMMRITDEHADIIKGYDGLLVEKIHKYNLYP